MPKDADISQVAVAIFKKVNIIFLGRVELDTLTQSFSIWLTIRYQGIPFLAWFTLDASRVVLVYE